MRGRPYRQRAASAPSEQSMGLYRTPGVHIESMAERFKPLGEVRMGVTAFLGRVSGGEANVPVKVDSFDRFCTMFGNDGSITAQAVRGFFENGGETAYVVNITPSDGRSVSPDDFIGAKAKRGLRVLEALEEVDLVVAPDLMACYGKEVGFETLDAIHAVQRAIIDHCERMQDRFAILDSPPKMDLDDIVAWRRRFDSSYAALYYPWIVTRVGEEAGPAIPPSGHIAGLFARCDIESGVHRAPANLKLQGIVDIDIFVHKRERDLLFDNKVNGIHAFPARGLRVWGSRTLASDKAFTHINVRRLFIMLRRSINLFAQWVVFEPNGHGLWKTLTRSVEAFLFEQYKKGSIVGTTPEEAFFVKCDEETNPPEARDAGELTIEIGVAPVKPAEFIVVRIHQWTREASPEKTEGAAEAAAG
jgi:phage tail sheath protein FI